MRKIERQITIVEWITSDGKVFPESEKRKALLHQDVVDGIKKYCPDCSGIGVIKTNIAQIDQKPFYVNEPCVKCKGKGYLQLEWG